MKSTILLKNKKIIVLKMICLVLFSSLFIIEKKEKVFEEDNIENESISEMIYNTMSDVDSYLNNLYSNKTNYHLTTEHNYGALNILNIDQYDLKLYYNCLGSLRHDLNHDNIISDLDNVGTNGGICQPTAVTMALRYMVERGYYSYNPQLNSDLIDKNNIFYDVASAYIANNWGGNGAYEVTCYNALNTYFSNVGANYNATLYNSNLLYYIDLAFSNSKPCIGHLYGDDGGHAVTIAGYYRKIVTYETSFMWWTNTETIVYNFAVINDGWHTSSIVNGGPLPNGWYDSNYSFVDVSKFDGVTYIS